jgi:hypothetical protein
MKILALCLSLLGLTTQHDFFDQAEIIAEINALKSEWKAGHNHYFDGKTVQEIKTLMGTFLETPEHLKLPLKEITPRNDIPESFDSRKQWPKCESIQ